MGGCRYDDGDDKDGCNHTGHTAGQRAFLCPWSLSRAHIHAHHGCDSGTERAGKVEAYRRDIIGNPLTVQYDGPVFLRFIIDQKKSKIQHEAGYHGWNAHANQLVDQHSVEMKVF